MGLFRNREKEEEQKRLEEWLLKAFEWDFVSEEDLKSAPVEDSTKWYESEVVGKAMDSFAINVFRKAASKIGISYNEVSGVFLKQNEEFFLQTCELKKDQYGFLDGEFVIKMCKALIVPKQDEVEEILNKIRRWSPEQKAEALQLLAELKIKITVEDI